MTETQKSERDDYSRDQIIEMLREVRKRTGVRHPDDLEPDDPATKAFVEWCAQDNPYMNTLPPKAAEHSWNFDKNMVYFDAGFDDPDYLDELAGDFLIQDLDNAEAGEDEEDMEDVIGKINDAISRVEAKLQLQQQKKA